MKNNITNREDLFLAKIAGYDVDVKTLMPPTASNVREKILLDIADKVNNQGTTATGGNTMFVTISEVGGGALEASASLTEICEAFQNGPVFIMCDGNVATVFEAEGNAVQAFATFIDDGHPVSMKIDGGVGSGGQDMWVVSWPEAKDTSPLISSLSMSTDASGHQVITADKTAIQVFEAVQQGRLMHGYMSMPDSDLTAILPIEAYNITSNGSDMYKFKMRCDMSRDDALFMSELLSATDTVVLTEVAN